MASSMTATRADVVTRTLDYLGDEQYRSEVESLVACDMPKEVPSTSLGAWAKRFEMQMRRRHEQIPRPW